MEKLIKNSTTLPAIEKINRSHSKLVLIFLTSLYPTLLIFLYAYIKNGFSRSGEYGVLIFVSSFYIAPLLIVGLVFFVKYIKSLKKHWSVLDRYNKMSVFLFFLHLVLYFMIIIRF